MAEGSPDTQQQRRRTSTTPHVKSRMRATRFPDFPISRFPDFPIARFRVYVAHRLARLGLATATLTLAALRLPHEHARVEHARHARCTRASLASDARALTLQPDPVDCPPIARVRPGHLILSGPQGPLKTKSS